MKTINETFEDREYKELIKIKGSKTWRKFILDLAGIKNEADKNEQDNTIE